MFDLNGSDYEIQCVEHWAGLWQTVGGLAAVIALFIVAMVFPDLPRGKSLQEISGGGWLFVTLMIFFAGFAIGLWANLLSAEAHIVRVDAASRRAEIAWRTLVETSSSLEAAKREWRDLIQKDSVLNGEPFVVTRLVMYSRDRRAVTTREEGGMFWEAFVYGTEHRKFPRLQM
jgi:hypothetical protein